VFLLFSFQQKGFFIEINKIIHLILNQTDFYSSNRKFSMRSLLVYCGSSTGTNPVYRSAAITLGEEMVKRQIRLIYGGGSVGLMGILANTILENGGEVVGVIPDFLDKMEVGHPSLTEMHVVSSMHERKALMEKMCDGIITLPGGFGSMDELFEALTWSQLGLHSKPIGLLNVNGFYDLLVGQIDCMVKEGFLKQENRNTLQVSGSVNELFSRMETYVPQPALKWLDRRQV
jgi:uncharacterized protein (TIGR00730 family)